MNYRILILLLTLAVTGNAAVKVHMSKVGDGYSGTSVNTAIFRNSSVVTHDSTQYAAYYDPDGYMVLAKRSLGTDNWTTLRSPYRGNIRDGHNVISIGVDGDGYIHASFDHHGNPLRYAHGVAPGSLELGPLVSMTGMDENDVTYPEFYTLPSGDMLFAYRSGASGRGNLVLNRYSVKDRTWSRIHDVLIDGENQRNAYWQMHVDGDGVIHLSWVWRETWLVETNHDLCYARSRDNGITWETSSGQPYSLPVTIATAEVACHIPQNSELINQTSMTSDSDGHPYIATYWRDTDSEVPQYRLVWHDGEKWHSNTVGHRTIPFSLSGGGTKMIPIARPVVASDGKNAYYIFRDEERGGKASVAVTADIASGMWEINDITDSSVGAWEPSIDKNLWNNRHILHIFMQRTFQGDGEKPVDDSAPTPVYIIEFPTN